MGTDAVLFDLDDTLCAYERSREEQLRTAFDRVGTEPLFGVEAFERWIDEVHGTSPLDLREKCFRGIAREQGFDTQLAEELATAYPEREPTNVRLLSGARETLATLEDRYALGVVSNGARETQRQKLSALGIADRFDATVFATPDSEIKPHPRPIERALDALDVRASDAVLVGDSVTADVDGARAAGVTPILYAPDERPAGAERAAITIESLQALTDAPWESSR